MKNNGFFSIMLTAVLSVFALCTFSSCEEDDAETMLGSIVGTVSCLGENTPIAGATVQLSGSMTLQTVTSGNGQYEFRNLEPGNYDIIVTANGYEGAQKTITVEAGRQSQGSIALAKEAVRVAISPVALAFGPQVNQLTFSIKNQGNSTLNYSISNYPAYISVSPAQAQVQAKGIQTVTVNVNRNAISRSETCTLLVNIGSDSYPVSININASDVSASMEVTPSTLNFGESQTDLSFYIKNKGTAGDISWEIEQPASNAVSVNKRSGTIPMGGTTPVTVHLDRSKMNGDLTTFINVNMSDGSGSVPVIINAIQAAGNGGNGGNGGNSGGIAVRNGLQAYYTFDDGTGADIINGYDGVLQGDPAEADDTPSRTGKAIKLLYNTKGQYFSIPYNPLKGYKTYSISMWVKDVSAGVLLEGGPVLEYLETQRFKFGATFSSSYSVTFNYDGLKLGAEWHMVTATWSDADRTGKIYIDGVLQDSQKFMYNEASSTTRLAVKTTMCFDNLRIYTRELTKDEVKEIYNSEL